MPFVHINAAGLVDEVVALAADREKTVEVLPRREAGLDLDRDLVTRRGQKERLQDIQAPELQRKVTNGPVPVFGYE